MLRPAKAATGVSYPAAHFLRPRPAFAVAVLFVLGITAHAILPAGPGVYLALAAVATLVAWWRVNRAATVLPLLAIAVFASGVALAQLRAFYFPRNHIGVHATDAGRLAWLEVVIDSPPRVVSDPAVHYRNASPREHATGRVVRVKTWTGWEACDGEVTLLFGEAVPGLRVGQTVRVFGDLHRPPPAMNPGQFDWAAYCRQERVLASASVKSAANVAVVAQPGWQPVAWVREKARDLLAAGVDAKHATDLAVLRTLVLGDNDPLVRPTREDFQRTGGAHLLAVSGLHVGVVAVVVLGACQMLRTSPRKAAWTVLGVIVLYGAVAQPNPPVWRAIALSVAFTLTVFMQRKVDAVQLLSVVTIGVLVWDPLAVYEAGFQLSFGCVLGLMLFSRRLKGYFAELHDRDVAVAESFRPPPPGRRLVVACRDACENYLSAGLVAWSIALPMVAGHFSQVNPWALAAGVLLMPVVFVALVGGVLKVVLTLVMPFGAGWWAALAGGLVHLMSWTADVLARVPGSQWPVRVPAGGWVVAFYALVILAFVPMLSRRRALVARIAGGLAVFAFAALPFLPRGEGNGVRVTLLSVGAGQCCVVEVPGERPVVIDAGSSTLSDPFHSVIAPYFQYTAIGPPGSVYISHGDHDHIGCVDAIVDAYGVPVTYASPHLGRLAKPGHEAAVVLAALDRRHVGPTLLRAGDRVTLGGAAIDVLWPPAAGSFSSNEAGLVLKLNYAGRSILFPADVQSVAETRLLERHPGELKADVLVAAHHGSAEITTGAFVRAVGPRFILSSDDDTPTKKQREFDALVAKAGIPLYHTHTGGALSVTIDPGGNIGVTPFRDNVR